MKKFVLKPLFFAHCAYVGALVAAVAMPHTISANPAVTLTNEEAALFMTHLAQLATYETDLITAHDKLFDPQSRLNTFASELDTLKELEQRIQNIAQNAPKGTKVVFRQYQAVVDKLAAAQSRWVQAVSHKSLEALFDIQAGMKTDFRRIQALMLAEGATGKGFIDNLRDAGRNDLANLAQAINQDITFIFHYDVRNRHYNGSQIKMGNHLVNHKGFKGVNWRLIIKKLGLK